MSSDSAHSLIRNAKKFFYGTFLSRIFGMCRDVFLAFFFGSSPEIAAFMLSYRFANLFRRLLGEGAMQAGFVPYFEELRYESAEKGARFFRDVFFTLFTLVLILVASLEIILGIFRKFQPTNSSSYEILTLIMIMLPGLIFISLFALNSSFLQCLKIYFLPAFAPVLFNIVWVISIFVSAAFSIQMAMISLAVGVVIAFIFQWGITQLRCQVFIAQSLRWSQWFQPKIFSKEIKHLYKPLLLSVIGVGAVQINSALDTIFARVSDPSGPAYLWYSIRLQMLPLSLFGVALAGALLPPLSRAMKRNNLVDYKRYLHTSLRSSFSLMMIFTVGIFVLGAAGLNLIYGRGDFTEIDTKEAIYCLWGYGFGLVPAAFVLLLSNGFYAQKSYKTPTICASLTVVINILLNSFFVYILHFKSSAIAFATSISAGFNCCFLMCMLSRQVNQLFTRGVYLSFLKSIICTVIAAIVVVIFGYFIVNDPTLSLIKGEGEIFFPRIFYQQCFYFFMQSIIYISLVFIIAKIIGHRDLIDLLKKIPVK